MRGRILDRALSLDARSLGIARILIGFLLLVDLVYRAADLRAFYTDDGVLPRSLYELSAWDYTWSIHTLAGSTAWIALLFIAQLLAAFCVLIGFRTRTSALISALLLGSLHARNPLLRDVQDDLFRVVLFWSVFLPLGRRYSIDRLQMREYGGDGILTVASASFLVQVVLIDFVGALAKLQSPWWKQGDGIFYALSNGRYQTPLAQFFVSQRGFLHVVNHAAIALELIIPLFLFVPRLRKTAVLVLIGMHFFDAMFLELGVYPFLCIAALVALLPRQEAEDDPHSSALQDGVATLALSLVLLLNVPTVFPGARVPKLARVLGATVGLDQAWALFAPPAITPLAMSDGWFVIAGETTPELAFSRPHRIAATIENHRWRQYFSNLRVTYDAGSAMERTVEGSREALLAWRCGHTTFSHVRLVYLVQPLGMPESQPKRVDLAERDCSRER